MNDKISLGYISDILDTISASKGLDKFHPAANDYINHDRLNYYDHVQEIILRKQFARHVIIITYIWIIFLPVFMIFVAAANTIQGKTALSDTVLIALISGASLSVIVGMISIILRHLFTGKRTQF